MRRVVAIALVLGTIVWSAAPVGAAGISGRFVDDDTSVHEGAIEAVATAGITVGCNPPTSDRFCPDALVTRGQMAAFMHRGFRDILTQGPATTFVDDDQSVFEADIEWLGATGVTRGCNPPTNNRFCPESVVTRAQMAAFLVRALGLTARGSATFVDDDNSEFEADIERLASAGITLGCNPPANDRFCPTDPVTRGQMASFLARALDLPVLAPRLVLSSGWFCSKDGLRCSGTATSPPGRTVRVAEGWEQALPYESGEEAAFTASNTYFELRIDGAVRATSGPVVSQSSTAATRTWSATITTPSSGTFSIEGRWYWQNTLVRLTRIVVTVG